MIAVTQYWEWFISTLSTFLGSEPIFSLVSALVFIMLCKGLRILMFGKE